MSNEPRIIVEKTFAHFVVGDVFALRWTVDGRPICPVCGFIWPLGAEPAWQPVGSTNKDGLPEAAPSWDICPGCDTQFGLDEDGTTEPTLEASWATLRQQGLRKMDMDAEAVRQVRENLNVVL